MPSHAPPWISEPWVREQAEVIERLSCAVTAGSEWRWLEVCCSLARGTADELSDVDAGVGYGGALRATDVQAAGVQLVRAGGPVLDVLVHVLPGSPPETRRLAAEYITGVQLDLVLMPSERRVGLPEGAVAVVDKDQRLAKPWRPCMQRPRRPLASLNGQLPRPRPPSAEASRPRGPSRRSGVLLKRCGLSDCPQQHHRRPYSNRASTSSLATGGVTCTTGTS